MAVAGVGVAAAIAIGVVSGIRDSDERGVHGIAPRAADAGIAVVVDAAAATPLSIAIDAAPVVVPDAAADAALPPDAATKQRPRPPPHLDHPTAPVDAAVAPPAQPDARASMFDQDPSHRLQLPGAGEK